MQIIPAIDLIDHKCVRLIQGDYEQKTEYSNDPVAQAKEFEQAGITRLHVVDLEGARNSKPAHVDLVARMCHETKLKIDFGGGVRNTSDVKIIIEAGAAMISIGSIAVDDPEKVIEWIDLFGADKFFIGADVKDGKIATHAWKNQSAYTAEEFISKWNHFGISNFFSTDVSRDGKLEGPAIDLYKRLISLFPNLNIVASGGVSSLNDLFSLADTGVSGVIVGKAIYEGRIKLNELKPWL
jgi:phosphoribosylformimino-5-aminoimidazole carboxamide ribotide isomerase